VNHLNINIYIDNSVGLFILLDECTCLKSLLLDELNTEKV